MALFNLVGGIGRGGDFAGPTQAGLGEAQGPTVPIGGLKASKFFGDKDKMALLGLLGSYRS